MHLLSLQTLLLVQLVLCFGSFSWAVRSFFVKPSGKTPGLQVTLISGFVFAVAHFVVLFFTPLISPALGAAASALYCLAFVIFWSAIDVNRKQPLAACFSGNEQLHLVERGPYRFVRHPFYCSYLLTWLAGGVATLNPLLLATFVVMAVLYRVAATKEEKKFAASPLADDYRRYRRCTGQFFPNPLAPARRFK